MSIEGERLERDRIRYESMTYEILDHPADVKFRAHGETLEDAFSEVVAAVSELVGGGNESAEPTVDREIELEARNLEALLFDFLNRLILLQDLEDAVVTGVTDLDIERTDDGHRLRAVIHGVAIPSDRPLLDIKAPTYSEMRIEREDGWTIEAVLDV